MYGQDNQNGVGTLLSSASFIEVFNAFGDKIIVLVAM
jgi:hypothetical protein